MLQSVLASKRHWPQGHKGLRTSECLPIEVGSTLKTMVTYVCWFLPPRRRTLWVTSVNVKQTLGSGMVCQGTEGLGEAGKSSCCHFQTHTCLLVEAICSLTPVTRAVVVLLNVSQAQLEDLHPIGENLGLIIKVIWIFPQPVSTRLCLHLPTVIVDEGLVIYKATGKKCRKSWAWLCHG